uniref:HECT-type E3 ubiquitin transferase n=1 Tax=Cryptomonas curvata TaxID=233186 RepID=A0A7S0M233_9CRYP
MGARRPAPAISSSARVPGDDTRGTADTELRQVLPCGSEKSVTRLVELSSGVNKGLLHSVLLHLCAHACTRPPTVRLLLAQALSPALARSELSRTSGSYPGSVAGLARRALEALCHLTALQPEVVSLLMDRTLLVDNENLSTPAAAYSGKGKNRAESRSDRGSTRVVESGAGCVSCEKHETNALDKMLLRLAEPDVIKNAATLDLFAQLILATVVAAKPSAVLQVDASAIPVLGEAAFRSLAVALGALGAGRQTGERLMGALQALCTHEKNRRVCVPLLLEHLRLAAVDCCKNLSSLDTSDPQGYYNGAVDEESSYADLRLLRLAKTLRSVWTASPISSGQSASQSDASKPSGSSGDIKGEGKFATDSTLSCVVGEDSLWSLLSSCLASIESHHTAASKSMSSASSIPPALSRLQPLVEAYFVVHAPLSPPSSSSGNSIVDQASAAHRGRPGLSLEGSSPPSEPWIEFAEKHRNSLNAYLRQDKTLLQSSSTFAGLVAFPKLLDFDNKKCYFRAELKRRNANQRHSTLRISVRREYVLEDSFHQMVLRRPDELKGRLHVTFQGEEGVDAGGLSREWFLTLSKQMLNPDKALFLPSVNGLTFQPNPASGIQPDHIGYFRFAGQVVAKALWDEQLLDAHFTLSLYKHILNQPIEVKDVESIDPEYFKNLGWMLENDITSVLEETFSIVREQFGEMLTIDLKPNGRNLSVTESNKHEYVQLVAEHVMTKGIRDQVDALKQGFHELIPSDLIQIFSPQELELLLCGLPSIDVDDLRANTEYTGYTRDSPQIQWFWSIVQGLCQEDLARLLQFVTGTSQVPMEGFQSLRGMNGPQRFNIHRCGDSGRLPSSHTCFNQLDLPEYPSSDVLQRCLLSAIREGFEGFGFS